LPDWHGFNEAPHFGASFFYGFNGLGLGGTVMRGVRGLAL